MENRKTSVRENSLIWFGAGVSIAEILTGTYFAPLGFQKGLIAIIIGHLIGCFLLFLAGYIGALSGKSAMETTKMSFGAKGGLIFAICNVMQLVGWTSIMIYDGALSASAAFNASKWIWCLVIGGLICIWLMLGITKIEKLNVLTMSALFILTLVLSKLIFFGGHTLTKTAEEALSFGAAVELAVAMPLSWLPLISDYTRNAKRPFAATLGSAATYGFVSCWMYIIGMGAAIFTDTYDISIIMVKAGLGIAGLVIIILSTVTTTFMDAYSAGISAVSIYSKINEKSFALIVTLLGTACAISFPMDDITDFLYMIGSIFAPMIAVMIADFYILKNDKHKTPFNVPNLVVWLAGFALYRYLMTKDIICGGTIPDMIVTMLLTIIIGEITKPKKRD